MARKRNAELLAAEQSTHDSENSLDNDAPPWKKIKTKSRKVVNLDSDKEVLDDALGATAPSENGSEMEGKFLSF